MATVLVIGGGPAGASFATRIAQLGHDAVLVERCASPQRQRIPETLAPSVRPLLAATGALRSVAQHGFPAAPDTRVLWGREEALRPGGEGLVVGRAIFDRLLLSHAAREGVRVLAPAQASWRRAASGGWLVTIAHERGRETIHAGLLADARGRSAPGGASRHALGRRTLTLEAVWEGDGLPSHAVIAAGGTCWAWGMPAGANRFATQVFADPRAIHASAGFTLRARFGNLVAETPLAAMLRDARIAGGVTARDASAWRAAEPVTQDSIRIGDAALALDPISSSGVQRAIQSALSAAIVANTLLEDPAMADHARSFYRHSLARAGAHHAAWAGAHYAYASAACGREDGFWTSRATSVAAEPSHEPVDPDEILAISPDLRLVDWPCLGPGRVELRRALMHPSLEEPVAFLAGLPLAPLLRGAPHGTLSVIARGWARHMPFDTALSIAVWLRRRGILSPVPAAGAEAA